MGNSAAGPEAGSRIFLAPIEDVAAVTIGSPKYAASSCPFCQAGMMFWNVTATYLIFVGSTSLAFRTWVRASSWKLRRTFTLIVLPSRSLADLIGESGRAMMLSESGAARDPSARMRSFSAPWSCAWNIDT
jgi:hypothetical protein